MRERERERERERVRESDYCKRVNAVKLKTFGFYFSVGANAENVQKTKVSSLTFFLRDAFSLEREREREREKVCVEESRRERERVRGICVWSCDSSYGDSQGSIIFFLSNKKII